MIAHVGDLLRQGFANLTPFSADQLLLQDQHGADVLTLVVKATFLLQKGRSLVPLEPQPPLSLSPVFHGEPGASSVKYETEAVPAKLTTDVVLIGHAHAPASRATRVEVSLRAGSLHKRVLVVGDRAWSRFMGTTTMSSPAPFERMPLTYERAFGGWDRSARDPEQHEVELRNPVGTGLIVRGNPDGVWLPNLEDPHQLIRRPSDRPAPAGFGFIAPHWEPRLRQAGKYDEHWLENRFPLAARDFDLRHFNAAHPDLQAPEFFTGGEPVEILNASAEGPLRFQLPAKRFEGVVKMKSGQRHLLGMVLDTVIINTDEMLVMLVWRGSLLIHRRAHELVWSKVQSVRESCGT
jgi:hypothetical protein